MDMCRAFKTTATVITIWLVFQPNCITWILIKCLFRMIMSWFLVSNTQRPFICDNRFWSIFDEYQHFFGKLSQKRKETNKKVENIIVKTWEEYVRLKEEEKAKFVMELGTKAVLSAAMPCLYFRCANKNNLYKIKRF